jgi:hypothetical protein
MLPLAIYQVRAGTAGLAAFAALSGVIFAAVGIGLILTVRQGVHVQATTDRLRDRHPDAPWLWRSDWATGHIFSEGGANALAAWLLATFWNATVWPIFYLIYFNPSQLFGALAGFEIVFHDPPVFGNCPDRMGDARDPPMAHCTRLLLRDGLDSRRNRWRPQRNHPPHAAEPGQP